MEKDHEENITVPCACFELVALSVRPRQVPALEATFAVALALSEETKSEGRGVGVVEERCGICTMAEGRLATSMIALAFQGK